MGWSYEKPKEVDPATIRTESNWTSDYPDSQDTWLEAMSPYYELVGEYEIDEMRTLYRYEIVESRKSELEPWSPKFHNVVISHSKVK